MLMTRRLLQVFGGIVLAAGCSDGKSPPVASEARQRAPLTQASVEGLGETEGWDAFGMRAMGEGQTTDRVVLSGSVGPTTDLGVSVYVELSRDAIPPFSGNIEWELAPDAWDTQRVVVQHQGVDYKVEHGQLELELEFGQSERLYRLSGAASSALLSHRAGASERYLEEEWTIRFQGPLVLVCSTRDPATLAETGAGIPVGSPGARTWVGDAQWSSNYCGWAKGQLLERGWSVQ